MARAGFTDRIAIGVADAKATGLPDGSFDVVMSNSLVHHVPEPAGALREMWRLASHGRHTLRP